MSRVIPSTVEIARIVEVAAKARGKASLLYKAAIVAYQDLSDRPGEKKSTEIARELFRLLDEISDKASVAYEQALPFERRGQHNYSIAAIDERIDELQKMKQKLIQEHSHAATSQCP